MATVILKQVTRLSHASVNYVPLTLQTVSMSTSKKGDFDYLRPYLKRRRAVTDRQGSSTGFRDIQGDDNDLRKDKGYRVKKPDVYPINLNCTGTLFKKYKPPELGNQSLISKQGNFNGVHKETNQTDKVITGLFESTHSMKAPSVVNKGYNSLRSLIKEAYQQSKRHISVQKFKDKADNFLLSSQSVLALRKLKKFDEDFDKKTFVGTAQDIYIRANKLLENHRDKETELDLFDVATETAVAKMTAGLKKKTLRWDFLESLEPPKIVSIATEEIMKDCTFSQVTVRFLSKQKLAIYDQFGRILAGSDSIASDVLEYIVFEKFIADLYGKWRVHDKLTTHDFDTIPTRRIPSLDDVIPDRQEIVYEGGERRREFNLKRIKLGL